MGKLCDEEEDLSLLERSKRNEIKKLLKELKSATSQGNVTEQSKLCNAIGNKFAAAGFLNLALQYHTQDLEISTEHGVRVDIAVAHRSVGEVYAELGEFPAAIEHQEQFLKISEEIEDLLEQQRAHATLGRTYYTKLMSESDERVVAETRKKAGHCYISALKLTDVLRAKRLSTEKEIMEMKSRLHLNIGLLYDKVNPDMSVKYLKRALEESKGNNDYAIHHLALLQLCETHLLSGELSQALLFGQQAVKAAKENDNSDNESTSNEILGLAYLHSESILLARRSAKRALQINSDLETAMSVYKVAKLIMSTQQVDFGETEREVGILSKISNILMKLSLNNQAVTWLQKELKLAKHCGVDASSVAEIHEKMGDCYKETGEYQLSLYHYTQQIALVSSPTTWTNIALLSLKDDQSYQECYDAVQAGMSEARTPQDQALCLNTLIEVALHFDKQDLLTSARAELSQINDSVPDSESLSQNDWMSDVEISESESETIDEENETQSTRKRRGGKLNKVNEKGETPLHQACVEGKVEKVRELLGKHASPNTRDHAGWTPLHEACNHGYLEIVVMLVSAGADINDRGGRECGGITPLHDAAQWGNVEITKYLVESGANTLAKDDEGRSALQLVESVLRDDPDDINNDNRLAIKNYLAEVSKNPPKPRKIVKKNDQDDLFTTGSNSSFSYQQALKPIVTSTQKSHSVDKENVSQRNMKQMRASDGVVYSRKRVNRTSRPLKQRASEPTKTGVSSKRPVVDDWLIEDQIPSPKRKVPQDPFLSRSSGKKRSRQSKLAPIKIEDEESSPEIPEMEPGPSHSAQPLPATLPQISDQPKLRVKIKIRDTMFFLPVKPGQTIADLAGEAAQRYRSKVGILPKLSLTTEDGAELDSDDLASQLLVDSDELVGVIERTEHVGLLEKYLETCSRLSVEPSLKDIFSGALSKVSISRSLASSKQLECFFTTILCCTGIKILDVSFNRLSKEVFNTFCSVIPSLTSLTEINVSGCGINNNNFLKVSKCLSKLPVNTLRLDYSSLSSCFVALIELLVSIPSLNTVSAKSCTLATKTFVSPELSEKFSNCNITALDLSQNFICHYPKLPRQLKSLTLGGTNIEKSGVKLPVTLENLCLENCYLNDINFREILQDLRNITSFSAPFNNLTGDSVVDLVMLFPRLTRLDLSSNPLGADGIETLSLVAPPELSLQNCRAGDVTADVITALHGTVGNCDLSYNKIDYPSFCRELSEEIRDCVICQGNKLVIKGAASSTR
ncbi:hypothetical protein ACHWQZ_G011473 [Mnemiopsis leidyi]